MATFKSKVLNLWSDDETLQMRIVPEVDKVRMFYNNGSFPVEFPLLTTQGENVGEKMNANAEAIQDETSRAIDAENLLNVNLSNETNRALSAEDALTVAFNDEKARVAAQEVFEANERALEQSQRISADNAFTATLNAEIQTRQANDTQHTNDINAELNRAQSEEARIEQKLDVYVSSNDAKVDAGDAKHDAYEVYANDRMLSIETKATADANTNATGLQTEIDTRTAEVSRLDGRIDFVVSNTDPAALDSLTEIVNKFNADGATYESRLNSLEQVIQQLVEQLNN